MLLDWVPAHFPRDSWALARFDGTPLYEHPDPRRGEHPDWGTLIFDYGRTEVRNFLVANAVYWLEEFHADGLRVDAVASMLYLDYSRKDGEWLPNAVGGRENLDAVALLREVNATCYRRAPGVMLIAEESTAWPGVTRPVHLGGLGFGLKWNMGWMHDTLRYLAHDPMFRSYHHNELTFSMMYAYSENFVLPLSHDEVVHGKGSLLGKMPGDDWKKFAGLRALLAYMWAHPGKQLIFMGSEFGQASEWSADAGVDWAALGGERNAGVQRLVADLNAAYRADPALWTQDFTPDGFGWIDANDSAGNVVSFLRQSGDGRVLACVANFSGGPHLEYRVGLPSAGRWTEVINTDAETYGGSGTGNYGGVEAVEEPWHGRPASAVLTVPPLGVLWLALEGVVAEDPAVEDAAAEDGGRGSAAEDAAAEDAAAADEAGETDEVAEVVEFPVHVPPPGPPSSAVPPAPATAPAPPAPSEPLVSSASPAPSEPYVPSEPQAPVVAPGAAGAGAAGAGGSGDGDDAGLGEAAVADL